jgi:hypothetical protein
MRAAPFLLLGLVLLSGCPKPKPSLYYTEASNSYATLTGKLGDDAYADEGMTKIEELLRKVPDDSLDAPQAKQLIGRIISERKRIETEKAAHDKALEQALKPTQGFAGSGTILEAPADVDAGNPRALHAGMSPEEVTKVSGDCFSYKETIKTFHGDGAEAQGRIWLLNADDVCHKRYPELESKALVFEQDKLFQIVSDNVIKRDGVDAGAPPAKPTQAAATKPTEPEVPAADTTKPPPDENTNPGQVEPPAPQ